MVNLYTFSAAKKIRLKTDFAKIFASGEKISSGPYLAMLRSNGLPYARLALLISKKAVRLACMRNRLRRKHREFFRYNQLDLLGCDIVVSLREKGWAMQQYENSIAEFWALIKRSI